MSKRDKKKTNMTRRANANAKAARERSGTKYRTVAFDPLDFDRLVSMAGDMFLRDGHHATTHLVFGETGGMHLVADATSHGRAVSLVGKTARRHRAVAVVSIGEAWMATGRGSAPPTIPASQIPGNFEVLVVAVESANESRSVLRRIKRNGNSVTLGDRVNGMPNLWGKHFGHLFDRDARLDNSDGG